MEKDGRSISCKYSKRRCNSVVLRQTENNEEATCDCKPCVCPWSVLGRCNWQGPLPVFRRHLRRHEPLQKFHGQEICYELNGINECQVWLRVQSCFSLDFIIVLEMLEKYADYKEFFGIVQLIGSRKQAESFYYRIEFKNNNKKRLFWKSPASSIQESITETKNCVKLDAKTLKWFIEEDVLKILITITKN